MYPELYCRQLVTILALSRLSGPLTAPPLSTLPQNRWKTPLECGSWASMLCPLAWEELAGGFVYWRGTQGRLCPEYGSAATGITYRTKTSVL